MAGRECVAYPIEPTDRWFSRNNEGIKIRDPARNCV